MFKIGKKSGNGSFKRAVNIGEPACSAFNCADQTVDPASLIAERQTCDDLTYQIEAEQKRALGLVYSRRNTFG